MYYYKILLQKIINHINIVPFFYYRIMTLGSGFSKMFYLTVNKKYKHRGKYVQIIKHMKSSYTTSSRDGRI